ncbi:MAG: phage tail assembly protein [Candidatus Accumulibacter sp.]|jgi:hypothetical protein|nr:phage tail assembly protein [Accumulibacter sp.]
MTETTQTEAARVDLLYPLKTPNGEVKTIHFRRGKAKDFVAAQRIESDPARRELLLMGMLSHEKLTMEDMEELDLADLVNVQATFQELFVAKSQSL